MRLRYLFLRWTTSLIARIDIIPINYLLFTQLCIVHAVECSCSLDLLLSLNSTVDRHFVIMRQTVLIIVCFLGFVLAGSPRLPRTSADQRGTRSANQNSTNAALSSSRNSQRNRWVPSGKIIDLVPGVLLTTKHIPPSYLFSFSRHRNARQAVMMGFSKRREASCMLNATRRYVNESIILPKPASCSLSI